MLKAYVPARLKTSAAWRYGLPFVSVAAALAATYLLQPYVFHAPLFFLAIMVSTWVGGTGPGLLATLLSTLSISQFLSQQGTPETPFQNVPNVAAFLLASLMVGAWSAARRRAECALQQARDALETKVRERTADLGRSNEQLQKEVNERKRAEEQLRRAEEKAHQVLDTIPQQIWSGPADATLDYCNYQWRAYAGLGLEEIQGDGWQSMLHPDDRERVLRAWYESVETGKPYEQEERHRRHDGVYRWFLCRGLPLRDAEGRIERWFGTNTDIEDRKRAEETVRQSEDRIRLIIDAIPVMAWSVRADGVVDFLNRRWMEYAALSLEQYVADPQGPIHPQDRQRVFAEWSARMALAQVYDDEMRLRRADGEYCWFLVRTAPLCDDRGNIVKWYGVAINIEDRKQAEEQLKRSNEELRALSARLHSVREEEGTRIAREIHDELGGALSSLKWDMEEIGEILSEETSPSRLAALQEKVGAMITLTDNTVDAVRRIASELRPTALDEFGIAEALRWHAQQFQARTGIATHCDCPTEGEALSREQAMAVFRIVQEALTNVMRHAQATRVEIKIRREGGDCLLTVSDNGRGITEVEKTGSQSLGLLGMRERAYLLGGELSVKGAEGRGTVVTLSVPINV